MVRGGIQGGVGMKPEAAYQVILSHQIQSQCESDPTNVQQYHLC